LLRKTLNGATQGTHLLHGAHIFLTNKKFKTMSTKQLYIRFNLKLEQLNQKGLVPIRCRITFNKKRIEIATGLYVQSDYWDPKKQILLDQSDQEETINMQLSLIKNKLSKAFLMFQIKEEAFTVNDIYNIFQGKSLEKDMGLLKFIISITKE
jgi:hypothetical protein